jgi:hypothetical protein
MSILQANLSENPCYGVNVAGVEYLEFSCLYGIEKFYAGYVVDCSTVEEANGRASE